MKNAKMGAKKDFFTEKRHFSMDYFHDTFNHSIPLVHQQITIMKSGMYCIKKWAIKLNSSPTNRKPTSIRQLIPHKTQPSRSSRPTGRLWSILSLETFRISCGELVEQVRTPRIGIGAITDPDMFNLKH